MCLRLKDIITGKRWWSHGDNYSGPDAQAPAVMYWFQLVRKLGGEVQWIPHLINNNSGVGTRILVFIGCKGHKRFDPTFSY